MSHERSWLALLMMFSMLLVTLVAGHAAFNAIQRRMATIGVLARTLFAHLRRPGQTVFILFLLQFAITTTLRNRVEFGADLHIIFSLLLVAALTWTAVRAVTGFSEGLHRLHPLDIENNLEARRINTQTRLLSRVAVFFVLLLGAASALMMFPDVRQIGASLLASAGIAGLVAGIAARPVLGNLIAGVQIALTQPLRLDDVVVIENEWGRIEEITSNYVVVKCWDERRLIVPLQWIAEHPFQNWTRQTAQLTGTVLLWVDYSVPLKALRSELTRVCTASANWDHRLALLQVVDTNERAMQLRALVTSSDASRNWDLRCEVREGLLDFLQREYPHALPTVRTEISRKGGAVVPLVPGADPSVPGGLPAADAARQFPDGRRRTG